MDYAMLTSLGPFAKALYGVLFMGMYSDLKRDDALRQGKDNGDKGPYGVYSESFLLFRGLHYKKKQLNEWEK